MATEDVDRLVRLAAFDFLARLREIQGDAMPYAALLRGFDYAGTRVPLLGPQGIFKKAC